MDRQRLSDNEEAFLIDLDLDEFEEEGETEDLPQVSAGEVLLLPETEDKGERLDKYVATKVPALSRSYIQELIETDHVLVDGQVRRSKFKITPGQKVLVTIPEPEEVSIGPEDIPLDIVYEDADVIVINKPAGMVVHPAPGHPSGTLVNALLHHAPDIAVGGSNRPGIIHRLDRDTSGLMVVVKTDRARTSLVSQWQERTVEKGYVALVYGEVEGEEATIDAPIGRDPQNRKKMAAIRGGREAITHLTVAERLRGATYLDLDLETGRTHQIRVHLAFIGHPIVGDALYNRYIGPYGGKNATVDRQFLHAARLAFRLPNGKGVVFEQPLPPDLQTGLERARMNDL
jgi:23S rRNA pseudouridine1911/1915/1917 synthase